MRILIIKPSALGDVATTLPLLCDVRAAHPDSQIDWLIQPSFAPLIEGHDAINDIIPFDRKQLASWWWKPSAFMAFRRLIRQLRVNRYDAVIDAQGLLRSAFFTWVTRAPMRIGFGLAREGAATAYTHKVYLPEGGLKMVAVDRMRALGRPLGTTPEGSPEFRVPISPAARKRAADMLSSAMSDPVVILPGARWDTKRWPLERFAEIAQRLLDDGEHVLLMGSPDEKSLCDHLAKEIENRKSKIENLTNLAGQTDIALMTALLARAKLVIGNDSGPLHIAVALGKQIVGLYGPTSPEFVGPFGQMQNVLRHDVPCHPCRRRECGHHSCMQGLTVELVWEKSASRVRNESDQMSPRTNIEFAPPNKGEEMGEPPATEVKDHGRSIDVPGGTIRAGEEYQRSAQPDGTVLVERPRASACIRFSSLFAKSKPGNPPADMRIIVAKEAAKREVQVEELLDGRHLITYDTNSVEGKTPIAMRWWITGLGEQLMMTSATVPVADIDRPETRQVFADARSMIESYVPSVEHKFIETATRTVQAVVTRSQTAATPQRRRELIKDEQNELSRRLIAARELVAQYCSSDPAAPEILDLAFSRWTADTSPSKAGLSEISEALGSAFGKLLCECLGMEWRIISDEFGEAWAVCEPNTSVATFPIQSVLKRAQKGEVRFFSDLFITIKQFVDSREYD